MLCKIQRLLSLVIYGFIGAFVGHSAYLFIDHQLRPQLYAAYSAPWHTQIFVNGLLTVLIAGTLFLIRLLIPRIFRQTNA